MMAYETRTSSVQMKVLELYFNVILYFLYNSVQVCGKALMCHHHSNAVFSNSFNSRMWQCLLYAI